MTGRRRIRSACLETGKAKGLPFLAFLLRPGLFTSLRRRGKNHRAVHLTPREIDKLLIFSAGELARQRRARGLKLNHPEAVALITADILELIRDGRSVAEIMTLGAAILPVDAVMEGVAE